MVQPVDYGSIIRSGQAIVPDYAAQQAQQQALALSQSQQQLAQQTQIFKQQEAQRDVDQETAYQNDLAAAIRSGNPQDIINLSRKYTKKSEDLKRSFDMQDQVVKDADLRQSVSILGYVSNGRADLAAKSLEDRIATARAAGEPDDPQDMAILEALKSGDPARVAEAKGLISYQVASITGVDNFSKTLGDLNPKANQTDIQKKVDYFKSIGRPDLAESILAQEDLVVIPQYGVIRGSDYAKGGGLSSDTAAAPTPSAAPASNGQPISFTPPFAGFDSAKPNSGMGASRDGGTRTHSGEDFAMPVGTPISAPADAKVVSVISNAKGGKQVILEFANGDRFGVAHLSEFNVRKGDTVSAGTVVGKSGNTGKSTGPHGHFTTTLANGKRVSPSEYLRTGGRPAPRVRSVQEALALPKGTEFITPDGKRKIR